ncbi:MAG: 2-dehydropantoate 2-reductase [Candidatus Izemoplasmatales bacterium]|nr:2-dehydropantoate 2-reductase [Candidatus Izemoplasmatales bacterium]
MKIAIYGAGSIGTILGAYLSKGGVEVDLFNRNATHIHGLKENGAHVIGKVDFTQKVRAFLPREIKDQYDIIFLMTKQLENKKVVTDLLPFLKDTGAVCTMQNGLPEQAISEIIGVKRTYGCTIGWGATLIGEGVCELTSEPSYEAMSFSLGTIDGRKDEMLLKIENILSKMGHVQIEDNFIGARWVKLLINCAFSGLSAVLGCTFGDVAKNKTSRLIAQRIIKECFDLAKKANIKIEPIQGKDIVKLLDYNNKLKQKISFLIIPIAIKKHSLIKSSMLQDLEKGKSCEIDAINGAVSEFGRNIGFETPYNDLVVQIIKKIESGKLKSSWENLSFFEDNLY